MNNKQYTIPHMKEIKIHGTKAWTYATVDGRDFKVHEDEDGDIQIRERIAEDTWTNRCEKDFIELAEKILGHA